MQALSADAVVALARRAFTASFASAVEKEGMLKRFDATVVALRAEYGV
jgi:hypothetical protein